MKNRIWREFLFYLPLISIIIFISACSSSSLKEGSTAEEVYNQAQAEFKKENWEEAAKLFDIIKLQYPASTYADDAQYYLAEINFKRDEFVMAAFNYSMLRRVYPNSPYAKDAMFKTSVSYFNLSPSYDRDQEYTHKAIDAFQDFQRTYPNDSLYNEATKYIMELRDKLAHREYFTAGLYRKLYSPDAAVIYYDNVIENYPDTSFYEPAMLGKIEVLVELEKFDQARTAIELYKRVFPNGKYTNQINSMEKSLK